MKSAAACILVLVVTASAWALDRFPPPEFTETNHTVPQTTQAPPRAEWLEYVDVAVLVAALAIGAALVFYKRSRTGLLLLTIAALLYFGFYREGCICAIGAIQNVSLAAGDSSYALPIFVAAFFLIPLVTSLFFGRVFCGSVCPLGAIQDLVLVRGIRIPDALAGGLRLLAYAYLGLAVLAAATASDFLICRFDPFVGIFRLSGELWMLILGASLLVLATFIGRPYCRFLCPYGVLLSWTSRFSRRRVTVTPGACVQCKLCEDACPFGAIHPSNTNSPVPRHKNRTALTIAVACVPLLVAAGALGGSYLAPAMARMHRTVRLQEELSARAAGADVEESLEASAFSATGRSAEALKVEAAAIGEKFEIGGPILGGFLALVVGLQLVAVFRRKTRPDYEADPAHCLACGRCYRYCPVHRKPHATLRNVEEAS